MKPKDIDYVALSLSPLFVGLNQDELRDLVNGAQLHDVKAEGVVVEEGEPGESIYLLHDGEVTIEKRADGGDRIELTRVSRRGDFFGEMVFVDILPRSATVRANPEACLIEFPLETLRSFFEGNRDAHLTVVLNMTRVLSKRLRAANEQIADLKRQG
ncbi:TPA: cyclic nucleotide-binding domain-containing protein [Candidatus Latescibacteria bacterium]|nr:cyclic nucleotide-binding domain-containing protein [Candidatus Latescibacterota bacterium]